MNATPNTNTLAAAFATATAALGAPQRPAPKPTPVPSQIDASASRLTHDELLLAVLRQSLTRADQFIARRTLLRAAPWEEAPI